jgi:hypothetical protein
MSIWTTGSTVIESWILGHVVGTLSVRSISTFLDAMGMKECF